MTASETQRPEGRDNTTVSRLNVAIDALTLAEDVRGIVPTQAAFGAASALLTMIRVRGLRSRCDGFPAYVYIFRTPWQMNRIASNSDRTAPIVVQCLTGK